MEPFVLRLTAKANGYHDMWVDGASQTVHTDRVPRPQMERLRLRDAKGQGRFVWRRVGVEAGLTWDDAAQSVFAVWTGSDESGRVTVGRW